MKTYIDLEKTMLGLFLGSKRLKNRLIRYWGIETIDGVEVFKSKLVVWPDTDSRPEAVKILKMFGMYNDVKSASFEGITDYYLRFNPSKVNVSDFAADIFANKLNSYVPVGESFIANLNYTDVNDPTAFTGMSSTDIYNYINTNYTTLLASQYLMSGADTLAEEAVALYIFLDDGTDFDVEVVNAVVTPITNVKNVNGSRVNYYTSGISLELKITKKFTIADNSAMVTAMLAETDSIRKQIITAIYYSTSSTDGLEAAEDTTTTDPLWYKGRLRVQATDSSYLDRDSFATLLAQAIDTGYTKKKTKWWKKLVSIVLAIVAVALSWVTAGGSLTLFATYLGIAALALTALQLALAYSGDTGWAEYLGKVVQVVSVVSMATGVYAWIQNAGKSAFMEALKRGALSEAFEIAKTAISTTVKSAVESLVENLTKLVNPASVSDVLPTLGELGSNKIVSVGSTVAQKAMDMRVASLNSDLTDLQEKVKESNEELLELTDKEVNIGIEDIKYYTKQLTADNLPFEVDYLYEGTLYNIGRPSFFPTGMNIRDKA